MSEQAPFTITLEYNNIKVTIVATNFKQILDAYMIGSAVIKEAQELGCGKPTLTTNLLSLKRSGEES